MENFKNITEHQLEVGEIGIFNSMNYLAVRNNGCADCSILYLNGKRCTGHGVKCKGISFKLVPKKEDIDPILESIDDTSNDGSDPTNICCEHFKTFIPLFSWFTINEDTLIMPNVDNIRVQHCPSCGKYIRDIQLSKKDYQQYFK